MRTTRTPDKIRSHYYVERELAARLRVAGKAERRVLYSQIYDELFAKVTDHPQLRRKVNSAARAQQIEREVAFLRPYLRTNGSFLEVGAGDCALSLAVARSVRSVIAVDVSRTIAEGAAPPSNFRLHLSDGTDIGVTANSIDLAYSNQLMEHLHPDDALDQLRNIYLSLVPGGLYICVTPNRLTGPHDISRCFDPVAKGLHLKEYSATELRSLMRQCGFSAVTWRAGLHGRYRQIPFEVLVRIEALLDRLAVPVRKVIASMFPLCNLLNGIVIATK